MNTKPSMGRSGNVARPLGLGYRWRYLLKNLTNVR